MRALWLLLLSGCSLVVQTSDLSGGARPDSGTPPTDSATAPETDACNPDVCYSETRVVKLSTIAPCSRTTADRFGCRKAIAAACKALDSCCFTGGYGPLDFPNAEETTILCLYEKPYDAPISELTSANAKCLASAPASRECDGAAHSSASKRTLGTAILQNATATTATLIGIDPDITTTAPVPWAELTKLDAGCSAATVESQACNSAAQRYCAGQPEEYAAGYGPVAWTMTEATIVCLAY